MLKKELRRIYSDKRLALQSNEVESLSQQICTRFFESFDPSGFSSIHIFLPIEKKKEVDTWFIIKKLHQNFKNTLTVISKSDPVTCELKSIIYTPETHLELNAWGIPEPSSGTIYAEKDINIVLLPLLVFDVKGNRVGYGKGFYDNFLKKCSDQVVKVGLSFFAPVDEITDIFEMDVPLNYCITPEKVYNFNE